MGRQVYGRWHLGLGRPSLPIAVCDVARCADVIAWCATHFDDAPPIVNLMDPALMTRREVALEMRRRGWRGRIVWVPISLLSLGLMTARTIVSLGYGQRPEKLSVWSVLRPRRFDSRLAAVVLDAANLNDTDQSRLVPEVSVTTTVFVTDGNERSARDRASARPPWHVGHRRRQ